MYNQNNMNAPRKLHKKDIVDILQGTLGATEVVKVESFDTERTRHICTGGRVINIIGKSYRSFPSESGMVNVEYFYCPNCRKLILNKSTLDYF